MVATLKERPTLVNDEKLTSLTAPASRFDFGEFFQGHTRATGWFSDVFGRPRRHFSGEFYGFYEGGDFVLDEKLYYTDGVTEDRLWRVNVDDEGNFRAESESLLGNATGKVRGNSLAMQYSMRVMIEHGKFWNLDMRDTMILQPDGSLHNINHVSKWGVRIGTVSVHYLHQDGENWQLPTMQKGADPSATRDDNLSRAKITSIDR